MILLKGQDLTCIRGSRLLFKNLNLSIQQGELAHLSGVNGSGKTSLLRIISGLLQPSAGQVRLTGEDGDEILLLPSSLYISTRDPLKAELSAHHYIKFWCRLYDFEQDKAQDILTEMSVPDMVIGQMSTGQKRRLSLCQLILSQRMIWLLDEPFLGLDDQGVALIYAKIREHIDQQGMVILANHGDSFIQPNQHIDLSKGALLL